MFGESWVMHGRVPIRPIPAIFCKKQNHRMAFEDIDMSGITRAFSQSAGKYQCGYYSVVSKGSICLLYK